MTHKKTNKKANAYALMVQDTGKEYKTLLRIVNTAVNNSTSSSSIRNMRSTRDEKQLMTRERKKVQLKT